MQKDPFKIDAVEYGLRKETWTFPNFLGGRVGETEVWNFPNFYFPTLSLPKKNSEMIKAWDQRKYNKIKCSIEVHIFLYWELFSQNRE